MRQMMVRKRVLALMGIFVLCSVCSATESGVQLVVRADQPGPQISPTMYGVFFEDINSAPTVGSTRNGQEPLLRVRRALLGRGRENVRRPPPSRSWTRSPAFPPSRTTCGSRPVGPVVPL